MNRARGDGTKPDSPPGGSQGRSLLSLSALLSPNTEPEPGFHITIYATGVVSLMGVFNLQLLHCPPPDLCCVLLGIARPLQGPVGSSQVAAEPAPRSLVG